MKLFERIFREANKARLLKPLYDIYNTDENISFDSLNEFATRFDNKFDWNRSDKKKLFDMILSAYNAYNEKGGSIKQRKIIIKQDISKLFKNRFGEKCVDKYDPNSELGEDIDVIILNELENKDWIFVVPLNYDVAVFMNSFNCGGQGARWCIGMEHTSYHWYDYVCDRQDIFVLALRKDAYNPAYKNDIKYMLEIEPETNTDDVCWSQENNRNYRIPEWKDKFGVTWNDISIALENHNVIQYFIDKYDQDGPSDDDYDY
jgi:hypothetical protein